MKYLLRILFIMALFCGLLQAPDAQRACDFHVQVLDPKCAASLMPAFAGYLTPSAPISVGLDCLGLSNCWSTKSSVESSTYGCAILLNLVVPFRADY